MVSGSKIYFDDVLEEIGSYGWYQKKMVLFFLIPLGIVIPWITMNVFFMVYTPDYWCHAPTSNLSFSAQNHHIESSNRSSCFTYNTSSSTKENCKSWDYDKTYFEETASSKWNLVCERDYLASLVLTLSYAGSAVGTPVYGTLSDRFGRKPVFFLLALLSTVSGIVSVFSPDLTTFIVLRVIHGSLMPSIYQLPYIILLEFVGPSKRTNMNGIFNIGYTVGMCTLPVIAYFSRHWVTFGFSTSLVTVLLFLYWRFLPESPRWLVSQERYEEAAAILSQVAAVNGKTQDEKHLATELKTIAEIENKKRLEANTSPLDLFRFSNLRKNFSIITLCWVADIFAYYGLILNVSNLSGNFFINFFLSALMEGPGLLCGWFFMEKYGRRWSSVAFLFITAISCLFAGFESDMPIMVQVTSLIGKFGASAAFFGVIQQSSELYPTTVRLIGMGVSAATAAAGQIILPFVVYLAVINKGIPFLIIGLLNLVAAFSAVFLPETLNKNLPLTIEEAEEFGKDQKFFPFSRKGKFSVSEEIGEKVFTLSYKESKEALTVYK